MPADKKGLTKQELTTLIDNELRQCFGYGDGKLEQQRRRNDYFFLGIAKEELAPPAIEGRSKVVDTTVRDTVLGMEGPLLKTFYGSDNVFEFEETKPEDAPQAKLISEYVNHIFRKKNPGYTICATWIREALQNKIGIVKVWWDDSDIETREDYFGQTIEQVTLLLDDPEVEIIEQKAYEDEDAAKEKTQALKQMQEQLAQMTQAAAQDPNAAQQLPQAQAQMQAFAAQPVPQLYDIALKRVTKGGRICIENVPPEEFLISKKAKSIKTSPFTAHRFQRTIAELKASGYTLPEPLPSDDSGAEQSLERIERMEYVDDDAGNPQDRYDNIDKSQRMVWVVETYLQVDMDGDGIPEWRKVVKSGSAILEDVEFDEPPFVALGSILLPHLFYGLCPADLAIEPQKIKTSLKRAVLDNMHLQVNGRQFAVKNQVNLDDLLSNRPGGIVRVENPNAVGPIQQGMSDIAGAMSVTEFFDREAQETTGYTRFSGGTSSELLSTNTSDQANIVTNRADERIESIARYMAETGFYELGLMILRLVCKYQRKAEMIKIGGEWTDIDPREWHNQFTLEVNVGLGTGNKGQVIRNLMLLGQKQAEGLQIGCATPENIYAANKRLANALGFKNGDEMFTDPKNMPPKQPQQDPAIVKAQLDDQAHQREMALKAQQAQMEAQNAQFRAQVEAEAQIRIDQARQQAELEKHALKTRMEAELAAVKEQNRATEQAQELAFQAHKLEKEIDAKIVIAQINAKQKEDAALQAAEQQANQDVAADDQIA